MAVFLRNAWGGFNETEHSSGHIIEKNVQMCVSGCVCDHVKVWVVENGREGVEKKARFK